VGSSLVKDLLIPEVKTYSKADLADVDVLIVFGSGSIANYPTVSSWLKKGETRFLVFIETQEESFLRAKGSSQALDPKIRFFYFKKGDEGIFQQIAWEFVFLRFAYAISDPSSHEAAEECLSKMEHYHLGVDLLASDCEDQGLKVLSNAMKNLSLLPRSKLGTSLAGKCAGMPAIICGAGPSLNEAIPLLAALKDRALFIAGGSAIAALNAQGIEPHLAVGLDPQPPTKRFLQQDGFETPFFYQGRFSHDLLQKVHAPLLWMPDSGSYPLEAWASAECGLFAERFDGGWTVANFCTAIAAHLGCSTVIFVGMDFSCGPSGVYASKMRGDEHQGELIELEKGKLYSRKDWLMAAEWTGAFAQKNPQIQWFNASANGIDLPGIPRRALSEILESLPEQGWDMQACVHSLVATASSSDVTLEKIKDVRNRVKVSFEKSLLLCDALLQIWEKHFPKSPLELGEYILLESDLEQEICSRYFLTPLWDVWKRPILRTDFHEVGQHLHRLLFFKQAIEIHVRSFS
jgi:hypothetical protein